MKKIIATSAVAVMLLTAAPAFAHEGKDGEEKFGVNLGALSRIFHDSEKGEKGERGEKGEKREKHDDDTKRNDDDKSSAISGTVTAKSGTTLTVAGKNGAVYTVDAANATFKSSHDTTFTLADIALNDVVHVKGEVSGTTVVATRITDKNAMQRSWLAMLKNVTLGVVTSISGSTFVIDPIGASTTGTVTTDSSTTFKQGGKATTSGALTVGSNVVVVGTTTADSGSNMLISASFVNIVNKSWGFLKHFLGQ